MSVLPTQPLRRHIYQRSTDVTHGRDLDSHIWVNVRTKLRKVSELHWLPDYKSRWLGAGDQWKPPHRGKSPREIPRSTTKPGPPQSTVNLQTNLIMLPHPPPFFKWTQAPIWLSVNLRRPMVEWKLGQRLWRWLRVDSTLGCLDWGPCGHKSGPCHTYCVAKCDLFRGNGRVKNNKHP